LPASPHLPARHHPWPGQPDHERTHSGRYGAPDIRPWLGCGNSIPRCVFPLSKTCWALIGVPKTSRDTKKDCGKPGCPNDHRRQVLARGDRDRMSATSAHGTFETSRNVRFSVAVGVPDISLTTHFGSEDIANAFCAARPMTIKPEQSSQATLSAPLRAAYYWRLGNSDTSNPDTVGRSSC
jgi:hypothetical protein